MSPQPSLPEIQAGFARIEITPEGPITLNESHWCGLSRGVHSPLYARAAAFRSGGRAAVLVSCDVIALLRDRAGEFRQAIAGATGVPPEAVLVAATQNHASPKTMPEDDKDRRWTENTALQTWFERWKAGTIEAARDAVRGLAPARFAFGLGNAPGIAGNRRPLRGDGRAVMTWYRPDADSIADPGVEDPSVRLVRVDAAEGGVRSILMNFACHPNVLWTTEVIASDFPGRACAILESAFGGRAVPVYFTGCCGNIDPFKYMRVPKNAYVAPEAFQPGSPVHLCLHESDRFGNMLGGEALRVAEGLDPAPLHGPVRWASVRFHGTLREGMKFDTEVEIQAMAVGHHLAFVGIPGEPFLEIELAIRSLSSFPTTFVCGQANGYSGYMPTRAAYAQGGYETGNSWTLFGPGIGEQVVEASLAALQAVH
ncbi:MAG: hypothetical protein HYU36_10580 [Planctomycetes bacterium]|nr:hypothetical protein [Planctomycetota bacterium]